MGKLLNLAVYNPAILDDANFLAGFVARQDLAASLLARLGEITPRGQARHHLILGQRGMGKTSLLRRLALGVRELAAHMHFASPESARWRHVLGIALCVVLVALTFAYLLYVVLRPEDF